MKNLFGKLFLVLTLAVGFAACNDNDDWYEEQMRRQELERIRIDSTLNAQKPILEAYALQNFDNPVLNDSTGIWFDLIEAGDDESYQYMISGGQILAPNVSVKYKGELMNGTVFEETTEDKTANFSLGNVISAWQFAFLPQSINYNGSDVPLIGLTEKGLKKGSKIKFITPSPYGYDNQAREKVPANSPLVFEIEVISIQNL